ncbi:MAG: hypothetical protein WD904_11890 [Dehalococcoidia bacterium]
MKLILLAITLVAAALLAACGDDDDSGSTPTPTPTPLVVTPTPAVTEPGDPCAPNVAGPAASGDLTWEAILPAEIPAPEGWTVADAEGDAPLLAAHDGTGVVGTIELLQFEVPFNPEGGYPALEAWASDFYEDVQVDRTDPGLGFALDTPTPVAFGDLCGMAYGYTITDDTDTVIERYAGRATFDSAKIYVVVALYDASIAEEMGFRSAEALAAYEPSLTPLVESLNVPVE